MLSERNVNFLIDNVHSEGFRSVAVLCFLLEVPVYHLGCAIDAVSGVAALSAQQPAEHVKNALQNITIDRTPQSVEGFLITSETVIFHNTIEE